MLASHLAPSPAGRSRVYVYRGEGAGWRSVRSAYESLQRLLPAQYEVATLSTDELLSGAWRERAALLVMPGGADLPYCRHLNGRGNGLIRDFVAGGGAYLGLCAGAYYAAARVEFERGDAALEVVGARELGFFPGVARGAAFAGFDYRSEAGAAAARLAFRVPRALAAAARAVLARAAGLGASADGGDGGAAGAGASSSSSSSSSSGGGAAAVARPGAAWATTADYCNGGPLFVAPDGGTDLSGLRGVTVLARYRELRGCHPQQEQEQQHDQQQQQQQQQQPWRAPAPLQASGLEQQLPGEPLPPPPAAAVRCEVGAGVAVLCGTHPELGPEWLDDQSGASNEHAGPADAAATAAAVGAGAEPLSPPCVRDAPVSRAAGAVVAFVTGAAAVTAVQQQRQQQGRRAAVAVREQQQQQQQEGQQQPTSRGAAEAPGADDVAAAAAAASAEEARLVAHTRELHARLSASQPRRDLFLSCLLFEALRREAAAGGGPCSGGSSG